MEYRADIHLLYGLSAGKWKAGMGGTVIMNNAESKTRETITAYREKIIRRINDIDNMDFLRFINNLLDAFKRKWGI